MAADEANELKQAQIGVNLSESEQGNLKNLGEQSKRQAANYLRLIEQLKILNETIKRVHVAENDSKL
mgnify:CR=1 FL=1